MRLRGALHQPVRTPASWPRCSPHFVPASPCSLVARMRSYRRTDWYGVEYLINHNGSVIPRCIPPVFVGCLVNWLALTGRMFAASEEESVFLSHPYTFQLVGLVFGYLTIYRINISYNRYWEGVTMVKNMHSKWADACAQTISFDRSKSSECDVTSDPFCCHVVRLFSQMSAMATMRLHVVEPGQSILFEELESRTAAEGRLKPLDAKSMSGRRASLVGKLKSSKSERMVAPAPPVRPAAAPVAAGLASAVENRSRAALGAVAQVASYHNLSNANVSKESKIRELAAGISSSERRLLLAAPCPVFATAQRIQRTIITRLHAGGVGAPPPIVSRIFQEISNGLLAYNNATKMKEIPVPFGYVQLNALFLNLFAPFLCPIAIASFTPTLWLSILTTGITVLSYYALFVVANEMEDPFGTNTNDMPMLSYHEEFCAMLCALVTNAWLPEDQWLVSQGKWVKPRTVGLAANAFFDAISSKKQVHISRERRAVPHDNLINRSKLRNKRRAVPGLSLFLSSKQKPTQALPAIIDQGNWGAQQQQDEMDSMAMVIQRASRARKARQKTKVAS